MQELSPAEKIYDRVLYHCTGLNNTVDREKTLKATAALAAQTLILNAEELSLHASTALEERANQISYYDSLCAKLATNDEATPTSASFLQQISVCTDTDAKRDSARRQAPKAKSNGDDTRPASTLEAPLIAYALSPSLRSFSDGCSKQQRLRTHCAIARQVARFALSDAIRLGGMDSQQAHTVFSCYFLERLNVEPLIRPAPATATPAAPAATTAHKNFLG